MAESKCGRYSIRDRIYYGRLFIGSKNKLVQRQFSWMVNGCLVIEREAYHRHLSDNRWQLEYSKIFAQPIWLYFRQSATPQCSLFIQEQ